MQKICYFTTKTKQQNIINRLSQYFVKTYSCFISFNKLDNPELLNFSPNVSHIVLTLSDGIVPCFESSYLLNSSFNSAKSFGVHNRSASPFLATFFLSFIFSCQKETVNRVSSRIDLHVVYYSMTIKKKENNKENPMHNFKARKRKMKC